MKVNVLQHHDASIKDIEKMIKLKIIVEKCDEFIKEKIVKECELNKISYVYQSEATISLLNNVVTAYVRMVCKTYKGEIYDLMVLFDEEFNLYNVVYKNIYKRVYE